MKVYIGKYVNWIGPYQLAEMIPFISEDTAHDIGKWLAETWINDVCEWFYSKNQRKIEVRIDEYDTWSMNNTLAHIILPMLKQLKETKHGSPIVDDEDVPPHMRYTNSKSDELGYDNWIHYKWEWILNEIIWAFEQELDDDWEAQFRHGEPEYICVPVNPKEEYVSNTLDDAMEHDDCFRMEQINPNYHVDYEGIRAYNARIQNGFRLFGKYYQNLWD